MGLQEGLEPSRLYRQRILSPLCLPIPPPERSVRTCALCLALGAHDVLRGVDYSVFKERILMRMFILYFVVGLYTRLLRQPAPAGVNKVFCLGRVAVCEGEPSCAYGCKLSCVEGAAGKKKGFPLFR